MWECDDGASIRRIDLTNLETTNQSVKLTRKFNCPTGLTNESVFLVIQDFSEIARVVINDVDLVPAIASPSDNRFEVTDHLLPHNSISISGDKLHGGLDVKVCLEICQAE